MRLQQVHQAVRASFDGQSVFVKAAVRYASSSAAGQQPPDQPTASTSTSTAATSEWTPMTRRTGVLATKKGMSCMWDAKGNRFPVTILHLDNVQVVATDTQTYNGQPRHTVTVGCMDRKPNTVTKTLLGQFNKAGVAPKRKLAQFTVTHDAVAPLGTRITAAHFVPGQHVDVQAPSIGKGFQGAMKRHGFKGLRASHGVSISHRSPGSTGMNQDPGRVFPGKKMPGRMGGKNVTTQNLLVHKVDLANDLVYVHGCVPGSPGTFVRVRDALKKVSWKAEELVKAGKTSSTGKDGGDLIGNVKSFPVVGDDKLAKSLPRQIEYIHQS